MLNEIPNDITKKTPACFEPTIDYVVTKIPKWAFEKFPETEPVLGTQMKSVAKSWPSAVPSRNPFESHALTETGKKVGSEKLETDRVKERLVTPNRTV